MKKTPGKPFQPGNSFGRGRPQGSRNKTTIALQEMLDGYGEAITRKCALLALQGDSSSMRLCMERIIPPRKDHPVKFKLGAVTTAEDVSAALSNLLQGVVTGQLTPSEGQMIATMLEGRRKFIATEEHEARIRALESGIDPNHDGRLISLEDPQPSEKKREDNDNE